MAPGVAIWHLALPDGHWRCRMAGRCRLTRGVAVYPRALPWGVAACHRALPYASWRCRVVSGVAGIPKVFTEISDEKSWHLDAPGCNPRLLTFRSFARMVKCDVSNFDVSVKNTIRVRMSQPQNATSVVKDFSPNLRQVGSR